ncbi:membrane-spanning 4-domains subfamily A member 3 [Macrotis lagotis]|uniref:membrane-spanning 4-domains subfamily A member 3 n=1 Tax=Macrotis lagotis TaxID=92651 RepID=UPI003D68B51B
MAQQIEENSQCVSIISHAHNRQMGQYAADKSTYGPLDESMKMVKGDPKVLGALQVLNGGVIFALGVFLGLFSHTSDIFITHFFMIFYSGYPFWGAAFFIISGSLSIIAEGKPTMNLVQSSFGMNIASATISVVGFIFLSINFVLNYWKVSECPSPSPNVCTLTSSTSTGILSLILILTMLEFCITIALTILGCKANCCESNEVVLSLPDSSVVAEMPPAELNSEGMEASIPMNDTEILSK